VGSAAYAGAPKTRVMVRNVKRRVRTPHAKPPRGTVDVSLDPEHA